MAALLAFSNSQQRVLSFPCPKCKTHLNVSDFDISVIRNCNFANDGKLSLEIIRTCPECGDSHYAYIKMEDFLHDE